MKVLIDTNILVYLWDISSAFHEKVTAKVKKLHNEGYQFYIAEQNILEYISTITNKRIFKDPLDALEINGEIKRLQESRLFSVIRPGKLTLTRQTEIVSKKSQAGSKSKTTIKSSAHIFDLYLTATMISNDLTAIFTVNVKDFEDVPGITIITV